MESQRVFLLFSREKETNNIYLSGCIRCREYPSDLQDIYYRVEEVVDLKEENKLYTMNNKAVQHHHYFKAERKKDDKIY